jgi:hypothetical protein
MIAANANRRLPTVGVKCSSKEKPFNAGPGKQCRLSRPCPEPRGQSAKGNIAAKIATFRILPAYAATHSLEAIINFEENLISAIYNAQLRIFLRKKGPSITVAFSTDL